MRSDAAARTPSPGPVRASPGLAEHFDRSGSGGASSVSLSVSQDVRDTFGSVAPERSADAEPAGPPADDSSPGAIVGQREVATRSLDDPGFRVARSVR